MGSKIEKILFIAVIVIAVMPFFFKINEFEKEDRVIESKKSSEILNFIEYDINKTEQSYKLYATKAEEIGNLWYLQNPKIVNSDIKSLTSKRAISKKNRDIEFIKDVKLFKFDGKKYFSQRAIYNTETKIIRTPKKFLISKEYDLVNGIKMEYDTSTQETKAKNVKGTFILKK